MTFRTAAKAPWVFAAGFWQRGYFSTTSGNITDDVIENYLNQHAAKDGFSPSP